MSWKRRTAAALMALAMIGTMAAAEDAGSQEQGRQGRKGMFAEGASGEMPEGWDGERPEGFPEGFPGGVNAPETQPEETAEDAASEEAEEAVPVRTGTEFDGKVVSGVRAAVTAPVGGTVESVSARAGQKVTAGDVLATLAAVKVYAPQDGTVSAVFGAPGDSTEEVAARYGAVLYIEPDSGRYVISADTANAYSNSDNLFIHVGERVYLKCYSDGAHTGKGFVSGVSGDSYTVEVTEGEFKLGETVSVFRQADCASASRLGRGECSRGSDVAVGGSGGTGNAGASAGAGIVKMCVSAGDHVAKGDVLYETVSGSYDAYYCTGTDIVASADGILAELNLSAGENVNENAVAATIYPESGLQLQLDVSEADLMYIHAGDSVLITFNWDDGETAYEGTVFAVSYAPQTASAGQQESGSETTYAAYVTFEPDENIRLGMTATAVVYSGQ